MCIVQLTTITSRPTYQTRLRNQWPPSHTTTRLAHQEFSRQYKALFALTPFKLSLKEEQCLSEFTDCRAAFRIASIWSRDFAT